MDKIYDFGIRDKEIECIHKWVQFIDTVEDCMVPPWYTSEEIEIIKNLDVVLRSKQEGGN